MTDIEIGVSVQGADIVDEIEDAIDDGIDSASGRTKNENNIPSEAVDIAKHRIRSVGAIWTGDLVDSFEVDVSHFHDRMIVVIENTSDHAAPIEYGAEYGEKGPPVAALIPWVMTKMSGFTLPEEERGKADIDRDKLEIETNFGSEDLGDSVPDHILAKAFWLQEHIKEEGIDAVRFMEIAEEWVEDEGSDVTASFITTELKKI